MNKRTTDALRNRISPKQRRKAEQPIGSRQPKRTVELEHNIQILSGRNLFCLNQLTKLVIRMEQDVYAGRPPGSVGTAPCMADFVVRCFLGHPIMTVKI